MPVDTQQILEAAEKVGQLLAQHPATEKYHQAQKSLSEDAEASRMLNEFNRQLMNLSRQQEAGMPVTDAQRHTLESLQMQIASHLKFKAMSIAQVDFMDLMRKVSEIIRSKVSDTGAGGSAPAGGAPPSSGPKLVI